MLESYTLVTREPRHSTITRAASNTSIITRLVCVRERERFCERITEALMQLALRLRRIPEVLRWPDAVVPSPELLEATETWHTNTRRLQNPILQASDLAG